MTHKKTLAHQVADELMRLITDGKTYAPGEQLPGENILSQELGVSRNTLREAIHLLASQGVLEVYRGKGTFIAKDIPVFGDYGIGQIDHLRTKLKDLYEVRLLLEPAMAALACHRATEEELAQIEEHAREVEQTIADGKNGRERILADQRLHGAIVAASHNHFASQLLPFINEAVESAITMGRDIERTLSSFSLKDHAVIVEFLKARDAIGAEHAMAVHLRHSMNALQLTDKEEQFLS